jgi:hypothetical protein
MKFDIKVYSLFCSGRKSKKKRHIKSIMDHNDKFVIEKLCSTSTQVFKWNLASCINYWSNGICLHGYFFIIIELLLATIAFTSQPFCLLLQSKPLSQLFKLFLFLKKWLMLYLELCLRICYLCFKMNFQPFLESVQRLISYQPT